ncbi:nucleoporin NUP42 isoform X1 [Sorex araneus]|uniref:nucleoporin NUP42 isoform X1 n=1 Tax=Sorex araneus TaxID=42254 RepID=UPI000158136E|nr:nucleoporin NUP42 isoform X1 [Sorex araneus]
MTVCQFFLQGRCRFGDRCWNEHPGARGAGGGRQQQSSGRGWNTSNQRYSSVIQPSSFSRSSPWGGSRDQEKSSFGSFDSGGSASRNRDFGLPQNPFNSLNSDEQKDEKKILEGIIKDMEIWESSGQWMFSVYSSVKKKSNISGFTDISPEELRLEYYNFLRSNNLQSYLNSVQQLINQWRNRINELKNLNTSTKISLLSDGGNQATSSFGFGSRQTAVFGSSGFPANNSNSNNVQNFSFKSSPGFGSGSSGNAPVFGSMSAFGAAPSASSAIPASAPAFGFAKPGVSSAASFSFKTSEASSFGSSGFSGFPTSMTTSPMSSPVAPAFGSNSSVTGFGGPGSQSHSAFTRPSSDTFGSGSMSSSLLASNGSTTADNVLFTPKDQLTSEELEQFQSKKFTLGKIPLKPPPVALLNI